MKVQLSFKTPDVLDQLEDVEKEAASDLIDKYLEYEEYIYIEFDTTKKTVTVLEKCDD